MIKKAARKSCNCFNSLAVYWVARSVYSAANDKLGTGTCAAALAAVVKSLAFLTLIFAIKISALIAITLSIISTNLFKLKLFFNKKRN